MGWYVLSHQWTKRGVIFANNTSGSRWNCTWRANIFARHGATVRWLLFILLGLRRAVERLVKRASVLIKRSHCRDNEQQACLKSSAARAKHYLCTSRLSSTPTLVHKPNSEQVRRSHVRKLVPVPELGLAVIPLTGLTHTDTILGSSARGASTSEQERVSSRWKLSFSSHVAYGRVVQTVARPSKAPAPYKRPCLFCPMDCSHTLPSLHICAISHLCISLDTVCMFSSF